MLKETVMLYYMILYELINNVILKPFLCFCSKNVQKWHHFASLSFAAASALSVWSSHAKVPGNPRIWGRESPSLIGRSTINGPCSMAMLNYQRVEDWFHRNIRRIRGRNVRMTRSLKLGPFRNVVFMRPLKGPQSAREVLNSPSLEHLETSRPSPAHSPSASRCWRFQRALQTLPTDPWRGEHSKPRTWAGYIYPIYPIHVESIELPWTTHPIQVASGLPGWQHDTLCDASPAPQTRATPPGLPMPGQKRSSLFQPLEVCDQFSSSWARTLLTSVNSQCADCFRKLKRLKSLRIPNGIRYTVVQDYLNWKK